MPSKKKQRNNKKWIGIILILVSIGLIWNPISGWVLNLANSLLNLYFLVGRLEMPHKFYGLTIMLFISWKILEAVLNVIGRILVKGINLLKENKK